MTQRLKESGLLRPADWTDMDLATTVNTRYDGPNVNIGGEAWSLMLDINYTAGASGVLDILWVPGDRAGNALTFTASADANGLQLATGITTDADASMVLGGGLGRSVTIWGNAAHGGSVTTGADALANLGWGFFRIEISTAMTTTPDCTGNAWLAYG